MNYGEFRTMVADWCQRSDMTAVIPRCVELATGQFNRVLRTPEMESRDTRSITTEFANLPDDFLEIISVSRSDGKTLRYLARPQLAEAVASGAQPEPQVFGIEDYQFRFLPAPTVGSPLVATILYYERIADLSADTDTNWLLTAYPDAYLYGTLMHARAWLHDDARVAFIKPMFDEAMAQVQRRKVAGTGVISAVGTDIPVTYRGFDIVRGY